MMTCQQHGWLTHQGGIIAVNIGLPLAIFLTGLPHQSWKLKTWVWDPWPWSSLRAFSPKRLVFFHFPVWVFLDTTDAKFVILYYPTRIHKRQWPAVKKPGSICGPSIFAARKVARVRSNCRLDKRQKQKATSRNSRHSPSVCMPGLWQLRSRPLG